MISPRFIIGIFFPLYCNREAASLAMENEKVARQWQRRTDFDFYKRRKENQIKFRNKFNLFIYLISFKSLHSLTANPMDFRDRRRRQTKNSITTSDPFFLWLRFYANKIIPFRDAIVSALEIAVNLHFIRHSTACRLNLRVEPKKDDESEWFVEGRL